MTETERAAATFDHDGYPAEVSLDAILTFEGTPAQFVFYTQRLYRNGSVEIEAVKDDFDRNAYRISYVTGGWSGCESVMGAIRQTMFMHYWRESKAGGLDVFEVPRDQWSGETGFWGSYSRRNGASATEGEARKHRLEVLHARKRALLLAANEFADAAPRTEADVAAAVESIRDRAYSEISKAAKASDKPVTDLADDLTARFEGLCRLLESEGHLTPMGTRQITAALADTIANH